MEEPTAQPQRRYRILEEEEEEPETTIVIPNIGDEEEDDTESYMRAIADQEAAEARAAQQTAGRTPAAGNAQDDGDDGVNLLDPAVTRRAMLSTWKKANIVLAVYLIPSTLALLAVLGVDWNSPCEESLRTWALVQALIQITVLCASSIVLCCLPKSDASDYRVELVYRTLRPVYMLSRAIDLFWFVWFVVGMVWTFRVSAKECVRNSNSLLLLITEML